MSAALSARVQASAAVALIIAIAAFVHAADKPPAKAPAPLAEEEYPLKTCLVSDEPLPSSGEFVAYTHTMPDKTEVTLRLCCEGCIEDFRQDPPKFLKKLETAKNKRPAAKAV